MKKRIASLLLSAAVLAACTGCRTAPASASLDSGSSSTSSGDPVPEVTPAPSAAPAGLLGELPVLYDAALTPCVPEFTVAEDFSNVINPDLVEYWNEEAKQKLLENGFVVCNSTNDEFYPQYESNRYVYIPSFVTVDASLHTYHLYFLYLQRQTEQAHLLPLLQELTTNMLAESRTQAEALTGTEWENAAQRNVAYFSVAAALLDPAMDAATLPEEAAQELTLIEAAAGIAPSPVMNLGEENGSQQEDYSQYIPRSYYTESEELTRYFKAMMWYGRMAFLQSDADKTRSAVLMNLALRDSGTQENWQRIYDVTCFFAGVSDDANTNDYLPLIDAAYGGSAQVSALPGNDAAWQTLMSSLETLKPAAINSIPIYEWEDRDTATAGYRFMGQRYTLDADILQQLVYRDVEQSADGRKRLLPDALDVPAALGSDTALDILHTQCDTDYPNYDDQMNTVRTKMAEAGEEVWNASLYSAWLNTLRPLTETRGEGWPQYMQTAAWRTKSLASFLGSWTELKHDTALYSKQVYAEMGGGGGIEEMDDRGWVETEPVVFGRLAALSRATSEGLEKLGLLDDNSKENLEKLYQLNYQLMVIAEKELRNELPTDEEFELIRSFGGQLEHFWLETVATDDQAFITPQEHPAALVADIATDPNGSVLQTATDVGTIYVLVSVDGSPRIAVGTVYSFYQFTQPLDQRMTDQDWWVELGKAPDAEGNFHWEERPAPPAWTEGHSVSTTYQVG